MVQYYYANIIIQIESTMDSDDKSKGHSPQDLLPLVREYLGTTLFKNVQQYQSIANTHSKYLQFNVQKTSGNNQSSSEYKNILIDDLLLQTNHKQIINLQLIRTIHINHTLICLCSDNLQLSNPKYAILIIVFGSKQGARKWSQSNLYLTKLSIKNPFKSIHKLYTSLPILLTHPESIIVKSKSQFFTKEPQIFKQYANLKFKQKKYQQALLVYQIGIGLLVDSDKKRERAVFYANSSQCLYQMRLYHVGHLYAEISVQLDRTYIKALYRKLSCALQLGGKDCPRIISAISLMGSQSELEQAQIKYSKYTANKCGLYNWMQIFESNSSSIGEFISSKVQLKKSLKGQYYYRTNKKISQHELILVHKPLIYKKSKQQQFNYQYANLTRQILLYSKLQTNFHSKFKSLPYQQILQGQQLKINKNNSTIGVNEIQTICLRCLQAEKSLQNNKGQKAQMIGIWQKLYYFQHQCLSNCSYLHVKGALVVFALQDIPSQQTLTLDFLSWQTVNRRTLMKQRLSKTCSCVVCYFEWSQYQHISTPQIFFQLLISAKNTGECRDYDKINLYFIWDLIHKKRGNQQQLIKHYLAILQRYPQWQFVINCLKFLRSGQNQNEIKDMIKATVKRILQRYLKINHNQAVKLLKIFL